MNIDTGEIRRFPDGTDVKKLLANAFVPIKEEDMTAKQKKEMRVSKFDSKSILGKLRSSTKSERNKARRKLRKKLSK